MKQRAATSATTSSNANGGRSDERIKRVDRALERMAERRTVTAAKLREAASEMRRAS